MGHGFKASHQYLGAFYTVFVSIIVPRIKYSTVNGLWPGQDKWSCYLPWSGNTELHLGGDYVRQAAKTQGTSQELLPCQLSQILYLHNSFFLKPDFRTFPLSFNNILFKITSSPLSLRLYLHSALEKSFSIWISIIWNFIIYSQCATLPSIYTMRMKTP